MGFGTRRFLPHLVCDQPECSSAKYRAANGQAEQDNISLPLHNIWPFQGKLMGSPKLPFTKLALFGERRQSTNRTHSLRSGWRAALTTKENINARGLQAP